MRRGERVHPGCPHRRFAAALACALALALPSTALAESPQARLDALLARETGEVAALVEPDGRLRDVVDGARLGGYGLPAAAYALLRQGRAEAGRRLVAYEVEKPGWGRFELWAMAQLYADPAARAALGSPLAGRLAAALSRFRAPTSGQRAGRCLARPSCFSNLRVVGAVAELTLLQTGLSSVPGRALLSDRRRLRRSVWRLLRSLPLVATPPATGGARLLSDPPVYPLAYHALSTAMLARALSTSAARDPRLRRLLAHTLDAAVALQGPDADLSYLGRGQDQVWVYAATAYAGLASARLLARDDRSRARRALALANRALDALEARAAAGTGFALVSGERLDYRGIDPYANFPTYNGLTLLFAQLARDEAARLPAGIAPAELPATSGHASFVDRRGTGLAVLARRGVWFSVHTRQSCARDMRCDQGLIALKLRRGGRWRDLLYPRPRTEDASAPAAGPVLLAGGRALRFRARRVSIGRRGDLVLRGGFGDARAAAMRFRALGDGVQLTLRGPRSARYGVLSLFPAAAGVEAAGGRLSDGRLSVELAPAARTQRRRRLFHSAPVADLAAYRSVVRTGGDGLLRIRWRAAD